MSAAPHPHVELLRVLYTDFGLLAEYAAEDMVLHQADRAVGTPPLAGRAAALRHEKALWDATDGTLDMDVAHVVADDSFGAVLGVLRATSPQTIAMPFCGLWRFRDGRIVEHWENAYAPHDLGRQLAGPTEEP